MKHTSSMAPRIRWRRARIAIFAASLERHCQDLLRRTRRSPDDVPANEFESRSNVAISSNSPAEYVRQALLNRKRNRNWKWKWWRDPAFFSIQGHHGRLYPSCRTSPGTAKFAAARDHRATCAGAYLHPQYPQERTRYIRNRRDGDDEWSELVIRQRYPLDRAEYRGHGDHGPCYRG